jgi:hypothetical protein
MMKAATFFVFIASFSGIFIKAEKGSFCPCQLDTEDVLQCEPDSIYNFPADILALCSDLIKPEEITAIEIYDQPISILTKDALTVFPNLIQLALSFNEIDTIEVGQRLQRERLAARAACSESGL